MCAHYKHRLYIKDCCRHYDVTILHTNIFDQTCKLLFAC